VPPPAPDDTNNSSVARGSLPPVIAISMYQSTTISSLFPSLGYVLPIITVLAMAILPRGKYLQNLALNLVSVCVGSAVALLTLWSAVEARHHTSPPAPPGAAPPRRPQYNSSQSAVCAVWLFSNIWAVNFLRAKLPSFNLASIIYSILTSVAATYGPLLTSSEQAQGFVLQLLSAMLLALAISTGVSLLVFPTTSRAVVFQQFSGAIGLLRKSVSLQGAYLHALEQEDMFTLEPVETAVGRDSEGARRRRKKQKKAVVTPNEAKERAAAKELRVAIALLSDLASKMHVEVKFAKRDIAWGKLDAKDLGALFNLFRRVFIPVYARRRASRVLCKLTEKQSWPEHNHGHLSESRRSSWVESWWGYSGRGFNRKGGREAHLERGHEAASRTVPHLVSGHQPRVGARSSPAGIDPSPQDGTAIFAGPEYRHRRRGSG